VVLFGTDGPLLSREEILQRAKALQEQHRFAFPFLTRAAALRELRETERFCELAGTCVVLRDDAHVAETLPLPRRLVNATIAGQTFALHLDLGATDLVVSTIPLDELKTVQTVVVSPLLRERDLRHLSRILGDPAH